jgi:two-component system chemotaxis sensor kinase CheA
MEVKAEYLAIFSEEASDQLREWEESLLALEKSPGDREQINGMFRAIHTLKGSAGFIGFDSLQKVTHDMESSLSAVREGTLAYNGELGDVLFKGLDICKTMIEAFTAGKVPAVDIVASSPPSSALRREPPLPPSRLPPLPPPRPRRGNRHAHPPTLRPRSPVPLRPAS